MAFNDDITLPKDGSGASVTYSLVSRNGQRAIRGDASSPVEEPKSLTISTEVAKNGRVSTVVQLVNAALVDCSTTCYTVPTPDEVKVHAKIQYNPKMGRVDLNQAVNEAVYQLVNFLVDSANVQKLLNRES